MKPSQDELPPPFADLREQFRQAAAREIEVERRLAERSRRSRLKVVAAVALGLAVPVAGVAGATRILSSDDGGPGTDKDVPVADAGIVPSTAAPDPDGGPPWAVKVFTNAQGRDCVAVGRLQGGKLGRLSGGEFIPLPERVSGVCGDLATDPVLGSISLIPRPARTVFFGISRDRAPITIQARGRRHVARPGALGTYVVVVKGELPRQSAVVSYRVRGREVRLRVP